MPRIDLDILNQKQTPAFYASSLATRPAYGFVGRIFIDSDSPSTGLYRDTGTAWVSIATPGSATPTLQSVTTAGSSTDVGITVTTNGIGIGTAIPGANLLDIHGTQAVLAQLENTTTQNSLLSFRNQGAGAWSVGNGYNAGSNDFIIYDAVSFATRLTIRNTGNVGINTATPTYKLDVSGTFRSTSDATINGLTVGLGGGSVSNNTVFGLQAGAGINTGTENVFIAYQAGKVNTSGARNVVIGSQAGKALSSGAENTIVGQFAGANLTAGSRNSYFGHQAGITDAGNDNVAIGDYSYNSGGASQNTYVGSASGKLNSTANNNTGVGFNVLAGLTTGGSNVGLGAQAGRYISGGSVANTTATNSIYIGYSTYALADGQTNQIVIGYNETGLGSNTTILGNLSTLTTAVRGNLLLGTTTDSGKKLQVNGTTTTAGFAASGEVLTVTATVSEQYYHVFTGAVGQTLTLLSPSANNLQYVIINNSANTVTVAAAASTNIVNTVGSSVATITLIANQRVFIIADGNNKYYQIF